MLSLALIGPVGVRNEASAAGGFQPNDALKEQLRAIMQEKATRTPAQKKISTHLLMPIRRAHGDPVMQAVPQFRSIVVLAENGTTQVRIKGTVTDDLLQAIEALGGTVLASFPQYGVIDARLPLMALETLAERGDIRSIREPDRFKTSKDNT